MSTSHTPSVSNIPASTSSFPGPSLLVGQRPVTQVSARNHPTITNHLSPNWMCPYEDRMQQPQALTGCGQLDVEMVQRFCVVWWFGKRYVHFVPCCSALTDYGFRMTRFLLLSLSTSVLSGQNGGSLIVRLPSSMLVKMMLNSMTLSTIFGLSAPSHCLILSRQMITSFYDVQA